MESSVPAALVVLAAVAVSLGYLLPHLVHRLQDAAEAPHEDRFSRTARVIEPTTAPAPASAEPSTRALLGAPHSVRTEFMNRPTIRPTGRPIAAPVAPKPASPRPAAAKATPPSQAGPVAVAAASGAPAASPQVRAAQLRGALTLALGLLTVLALILFAAKGLTLWAAAICAGLTVGVLAAGHHAVASQRRQAAPKGRTRRPADSWAQGIWAWLGLGAVAPNVVATAPQHAAHTDAELTAMAAHPASGTREVTAAPASVRAPSAEAMAAHPASGTRATTQKPAPVAKPGPAALPARAGAARPVGQAGVPVGARRPARRPGVSGRIQNGHHTVALPPPLTISELDLATLGMGLDEPLAPEETLVLAEASAEAARLAAAEQAASEPAGWTPVMAPAPVYTLSSEAARWEPKALSAEDYEQARRAALRATDAASAQARAAGVDDQITPVMGQDALPPRVVFREGALDLDRALETRRRAVGE